MTSKATEDLTSAGANGGDIPNLNRSLVVVRVRSSDAFEYELTADAAMASGLLRDVLEKREDEDDDGSTAASSPSSAENQSPIEIQSVGHIALEKVVEFLIHHATEPMEKLPSELTATNFEEAVPIQWYRDFCSERAGMTLDVLSDVMRAANYMDIEALLDLVCAKFAFIMQGMDNDELGDILGLQEMTSEELSAVCEEYPWFFSP